MTRSMKLAIWIGGIALLAATAIDTLAVIGRYVGLPLTGSIELMQAAVVVSGSVGLVIATVANTHARVVLLVDRLSPGWRKVADRFSDALTLVFALSLLIGSAWIAADLWASHEVSEVLGVPWRYLRLVVNAALLLTCGYLLVRLFRKAGE